VLTLSSSNEAAMQCVLHTFDDVIEEAVEASCRHVEAPK